MNQNQLRGVNLGGWLVLEKWMTPSLFQGYKSEDEFNLCLEQGNKAKEKITEHRNSFITASDFKKISELGFNAVRLPVGHWLFGRYKPFVGADEYVERALDWAEKYELRVIIDLHTAPGSQNGEVHSGHIGEINWHKDTGNIDVTVETIGKIAKKFGKHKSLWGIELLNEPSKDILLRDLQDYYVRAHDAARKHLADDIRIIISDAYRPLAEWEDFIKLPELKNVLLDVHLYQIFGDKDQKLTFDEHISKTLKWKTQLEAFGAENIIVGEWSGALANTYDSMDASAARAAKQMYMDAQKFAFKNCAGHFYWNYKTEAKDAWSYL